MGAPAAGNNSDAIAKSFDYINTTLQSFVADFSTNFINQIDGIVVSMLVASFAFYGWLIVRGQSSEPVGDTLQKVAFISLVCAASLSSGTYQTQIANAILSAPDGLMQSLTTGGYQASGGNAMAQVLDTTLSEGLKKAGEFWDKGDLGIVGESNVAPYLYAILVIIGTVFVLIVATFWLFAAKIILSLVLGVGPLFIAFVYWPQTRGYFWAWFSTILNLLLTIVFIAGVFSLFNKIFSVGLANLAPDDDTSRQLGETAIVAFMGILTCGVLLLVPRYVSFLVQGAGVGGAGSTLSQLGGAIAGAAGKAAGSAGNAHNKSQANKAGSAAYQGTLKSGGTHQQAFEAQSAAHGAVRASYFRGSRGRR